MKNIMIILTCFIMQVIVQTAEAWETQNPFQSQSLTLSVGDITNHEPGFVVIEESEIPKSLLNENQGRFVREREYNLGMAFHYPLGYYLDISDWDGALFGQIKIPVNENIFWGLHLSYTGGHANELESDISFAEISIRMVELYPYLDIYPQKYGNLFFRSAIGLNFWHHDIKYWHLRQKFNLENDGVDIMIGFGVGINLGRRVEMVALYSRIITGDFTEGYIRVNLGYCFGS